MRLILNFINDNVANNFIYILLSETAVERSARHPSNRQPNLNRLAVETLQSSVSITPPLIGQSIKNSYRAAQKAA